MTLQEKLDQLSLTTMSRQLDHTVADALSKNLSLVQALESLVDCELEARSGRPIERRFRLSRLHARFSIASFHFKHHKSRMDIKPRILRLLDLEFLGKGTSVIPASPVHHGHGYAQSPARFPGRSFSGAQTARLH